MSPTHQVLKVWIRSEPGAALVERDSLGVETGRGIRGDHTFGRLRHVTIVFEDDWNAAGDEIGARPDPVGRRANVLVSGGNGARHVGSRVRLGSVLLEVKGILAPCAVMDEVAGGLRAALEPDGRGGIWGRVIEGGEIRPGDRLAPAEPRAQEDRH